MRTICRDIGFPRPNFVDVFSSCFLLQGLFSFLPVIAHILGPGEHCILCTHDFPSYGVFKAELHPERYSASVTITKVGRFCSGSKQFYLDLSFGESLLSRITPHSGRVPRVESECDENSGALGFQPEFWVGIGKPLTAFVPKCRRV